MALKTGNRILDALGGSPWPKSHGAIKFFFDDSGPGGAWTLQEEQQFWGAVHTWRSVADVNIVEVNRAAAADMIEQKATNKEVGTKFSGQHDYPTTPNPVGQYNVQRYWTPEAMQVGGRTFGLFIHELGHAIGLAHPHDNGMGTPLFPGVTLGSTRDTGDNGLNTQFGTIMSYVRTNLSLPSADRSTNFGHAATPMAFDVAAIQLLYGAVHNNTGRNVYVLPDANTARTAYQCIWDTGGFDEIRYNGARNATIDLRPAHLQNAPGGSGFVSRAEGIQGGFTIAADRTGFIADVNGEWGVIIENATGGSGNDTLVGNAARNILTGNGGNDHLNGFGGADDMRGGFGSDEYVIDNRFDTAVDTFFFDVTGVRDKIYTTLASFDLGDTARSRHVEILQYTGTGNFIGWGSGLDNTLVGAAGADTLYGRDGLDELRGAGGADTLDGGIGNDGLYGEAGLDRLYGRDGNDRLDGGLDNDVLYGSMGTDTLAGGAGRDTLSGGDGDDLYLLDSSADVDVLIEAAGLPGGVDRVHSSRSLAVLAANVENLVLLSASLDQVGHGNDGANSLIGNSRANTLLGLGGADTISGGSGLDTLEGGLGADLLVGGLGEDTFRYRGAVAEIGGDTVFGGVATLDNAVDALDFSGLAGSVVVNLAADRFTAGDGASVATGVARGIEKVIGSAGDDGLSGGAGADSLSGGAGLDTLTGGAGADTLFGGNDNDLIVADNLDLINGGSGIDTVHADATTVAAGYRFSLFRTQVDYVHGNTGDDALDATRVFTAVTLAGADGDDTLTGGNAGDRLDAGAGADSVQGGGGADSITGGEGADTIDGGAGSDTVDGGAGADSLAGGGDGDNLFGDTGDDTLDGGEGGDTLTGGEGADSLMGGTGDDWFFTDGFDQISGGDGSDRVDFFGGAGFSLALAAASIETAYAGSGGDALDATGVSANVRLSGAGGNDTLIGGGGNDTVTGEEDDDSLSGGGGNDDLQGAEGSDTIDGGAGDDSLMAGAGADSLTGGDGWDLLWMLDNDDTVSGGDGYDQAWAGAQTVATGFVFTVAGTGVEGVSGHNGNDDIDGSGSDFVALTGYAGADTLTGGADGDVISGGAGDDSLTGGAGGDLFEFSFEGTTTDADTIVDFGDSAGNEDIIRLAGRGIGFDELVMTQSGADVVIELNATDRITLRNTALGTLDSSDFHFFV